MNTLRRPLPFSAARRALLSLAVSAGALACLAPGASAATAPAATTGRSESVTFSSAIVFAAINPHGEDTNYVFQYGTPGNTAHRRRSRPPATARARSGSARRSRACAPGPPTTTGSSRAVPPARPTAPTERSRRPGAAVGAIVGMPNPVVFGSPFVVEGTLSGTGASNHAIVLQANPFPYIGGFQTVGNPRADQRDRRLLLPVRWACSKTRRYAWSPWASLKSRARWWSRTSPCTSPSTSTPPAGAASRASTARSPRRRSARSSASSCCRRRSHGQQGRHGRHGRHRHRVEVQPRRAVVRPRPLPRARQGHDGAHVSAYSPPVLVR